ncbi:reverse transcriptase domain-containing protein [Klebsiella pneumoniae]|uniref:reverse transcriptase domain-containing protein n=1 Tax=Klebsiella pneumoniae TaxID=573 RepID=UPI00224BA1EA|nr:reverse transcriptase domain-containing protein [Klebsiella pneumoniae]
MLSNILLDELDKKLTYKHLKFARYADDIIILVKTKSEGLIIQREITAFITKRLKLKVNERKVEWVQYQAQNFSGSHSVTVKCRSTNRR